MVLKFSHLAEALGGKLTLFKVTYLGEEVGAGTGAHVKPVQPQRTRHIHLKIHLSFLLFLPFPHESLGSLPEPTQWPLRQSGKLRQGYVGVIFFPIFSESPGGRSQAPAERGQRGRKWESLGKFPFEQLSEQAIHLDTA